MKNSSKLACVVPVAQPCTFNTPRGAPEFRLIIYALCSNTSDMLHRPSKHGRVGLTFQVQQPGCWRKLLPILAMRTRQSEVGRRRTVLDRGRPTVEDFDRVLALLESAEKRMKQ